MLGEGTKARRHEGTEGRSLRDGGIGELGNSNHETGGFEIFERRSVRHGLKTRVTGGVLVVKSLDPRGREKKRVSEGESSSQQKIATHGLEARVTIGMGDYTGTR